MNGVTDILRSVFCRLGGVKTARGVFGLLLFGVGGGILWGCITHTTWALVVGLVSILPAWVTFRIWEELK